VPQRNQALSLSYREGGKKDLAGNSRGGKILKGEGIFEKRRISAEGESFLSQKKTDSGEKSDVLSGGPHIRNLAGKKKIASSRAKNSHPRKKAEEVARDSRHERGDRSSIGGKSRVSTRRETVRESAFKQREGGMLPYQTSRIARQTLHYQNAV